MKFNFTNTGKEKWHFSHTFLIGTINFLIGFLVAWFVWSTTVSYVLRNAAQY